MISSSFSRLVPSCPKPIALAHEEGVGTLPTETRGVEQGGSRPSAVLVSRTLALRRQRTLAKAKGSGMYLIMHVVYIKLYG